MSGFRINFVPLAFYLFLLTLAFFLSSTLGGPLTGLAALLFFFLALDLVQVLLTSTQVFLSEKFSSDHGIKGQSLDYRLSLEAGMVPFRTSRMDCELRFDSPLLEGQGEKETLWMGIGEKRERIKKMTCRFRGVYCLGLVSWEIRSWSGWFHWSQDLWPRTFYVLPRVVPLGKSSAVFRQWGAGYPGSFADQSPPALFDHVVPYRDGLPLKYLDWKPLARGQDPVVRNFQPETWRQVSFFVDLGIEAESGPPTEDTLDSQDLCIETAASLIHGLLEEGVPVSCWTCLGSSGTLTDLAAFRSWLESTVAWKFGAYPSLAEVWKFSDQKNGPQGAVFVSQRPDPVLWELLVHLPGERSMVSILRGWDDTQKRVWGEWQGNLNRSGCNVVEIQELDDLTGVVHG